MKKKNKKSGITTEDSQINSVAAKKQKTGKKEKSCITSVFSVKA